jgi:predicted small lipoprotein YifL
MKKLYALFLVTVLITLLAGCGSQGVTLTGADKDAVLAFSESKTDNLLAGMNAGDYAKFSADFDSAMLNAISQTQFDDMKKDRDAKLGLYVSRQVNSVVKQGEYYVVIYAAKFEKDNAVIVRVVFLGAESHLVSGLWFNK